MTDRQKTASGDPETEIADGKRGSTGGNGAAPEFSQEQSDADETIDLATLIAERAEYLEQLQRSRAEFVNYRRRVEQEREQIREIASRSLLAQMVPVLDDLHRALAAVPEEDRETPWVQGVAHIERKLSGILERAGVTPIEALGEPFDPAQHEAVATEPGSSQNVVVEVYQNGYRLGQSLLRPAMVKVGDRQDEVGSSQ